MRNRQRQVAWLACLLLAAPGCTGCVHVLTEKELLIGGRQAGDVAPSADGLEIPTEDGMVLRGYRFANPGSLVVVVYFGGNGEWIAPNSLLGPRGERHGIDTYAVNYRGYGPSDGVSSLDALQADALRVFDAVAERPEIAGRPIVVYGTSLGATAALHVAARRPVDGVVLEAPPSDAASNTPAMRRALPWFVRPFVRLRAAPEIADRRPQPIDDARSVTAPLLVIHGTRDRVIAFRFGEELYNAAASEDKTLCPVEKTGHNTIWREGGQVPHDCLARFLANLTDATGGASP